MKITMETDYALRIMQFIAARNTVTDSKTISEAVRVSPRFTSKILRKLTYGGFIVSFKGTNGGYKLARPADKITLLQIIELIEEPIAISPCLSEKFVCRNENEIGKKRCECFFSRVFDEINMDIAAKLSSITIADSVKQAGKQNE